MNLVTAVVVLLAHLVFVHPQPYITVEGADGSVVSSGLVWADFALANTSWASRGGMSHAISDSGDFAHASWGIADYGTQGSLIAEKLLAFGSDRERATVRGWLMKSTAIPSSGRAFGIEEGLFHMGSQGAFESNAELLLMAKAYAAHAGDAQAVFHTIPERLVCFVPTSSPGSPQLLGPSQPGLSDRICTEVPEQLLELLPEVNTLFYEWPVQAQSVVTEHFTLDAPGKALTAIVTLPEPAASLLLPIAPQYHEGVLASTITVIDTLTAQVVGTLNISAGDSPGASSWTTIQLCYGTKSTDHGTTSTGCSSPVGPGDFLVVLEIQTLQEKGTAGLCAPGWVSNPFPSTNGTSGHIVYSSSGGGNINLAAPDELLGSNTMWSLAQRLSATASWQIASSVLDADAGMYLRNLLLSGRDPSADAIWTFSTTSFDLFAIRDPVFSGAPFIGINSACSYYDLYRMGFASTYMNLLHVKSLAAFQELQGAFLVASDCASPGVPCVPRDLVDKALGETTLAVSRRLGLPGTGRFVSWVGCSCSINAMLTCDLSLIENGTVIASAGSAGDCFHIADIGFVPDVALAAELGMSPMGDPVGASLSTLNATLQSVRVQAGQFRTNAIPFESLKSAGPGFWLPQDRWVYRDENGFAERWANQTGDWMLFAPPENASASDGNGAWGLNEENGGVLFSTTGLALQAGLYDGMVHDWKGLVDSLSAIAGQLDPLNTSQPILPDQRAFVRKPITSPLIQSLCEAPRGGAGSVDAWGELECSYYKSVTFDLPENGFALYALLKGLLDLRIDAGGVLSLWGETCTTPLPCSISVAKPQGWDSASGSLSALIANQLVVGGIAVQLALSVGTHTLDVVVSEA